MIKPYLVINKPRKKVAFKIKTKKVERTKLLLIKEIKTLNKPYIQMEKKLIAKSYKDKVIKRIF